MCALLITMRSIRLISRADIYIYIIKMKIHSSCEIEDFVETHLCKLCVILRSRAYIYICTTQTSVSQCVYPVARLSGNHDSGTDRSEV